MNIKLIIFDLDGVLVDAKEIHYDALNRAIEEVAGSEYIITEKEHVSKYDGLNTSKKLSLLTEDKNLPERHYDSIWSLKQKYTNQAISSLSINQDIQNVLEKLKKENYTLCVASNSIRDTVKTMLLKSGFMEYFDFWYSNEDVKNPKPNPEIYLRCMIKAGVSPRETLIIEDSEVGRYSASLSGAYICPVKNTKDVTYEHIKSHLEHDNKRQLNVLKWKDKSMNVLIPMAGAGSRFQQAGYTFPKPLIEVHGKPMIQLVTENLAMDANFIYIVQKEHYEKYNLKYMLNLISPGCEIIQVEGVTQGAACTVLLAEELINNDEPLLIANSDQMLEWNSSTFMYKMINADVDGGIVTFTATHPKWSFAKVDGEGYVTEVAEKKPISDIATVGVYYFKQGKDFVQAAKQMIDKDIRVNNEFYVCPIFNELILNGKKIRTHHIEKMWGIGTPEDLDKYLGATCK